MLYDRNSIILRNRLMKQTLHLQYACNDNVK